MAYNKKQMKPLIDKYQINPETNKLFITITDMFDGQPNYQIWAVKMIFSLCMTMETLKQIKEWVDNNQASIVKLDKKNIVSYSSKTAIGLLLKEMEGLDKMNFIKFVVNHFNTDQRKMLNDKIFTKDFTPIEAYASRDITHWYDVLKSFNKKPMDRKNRFYSSCSAVKDINTLERLILDCLKESYVWEKDDLLAFVEHNTKDCEVIFDNGGCVLLRVPSYESAHKLCGNGRTQWCIARENDYFKRYVTNYNGKRSQYFLFDFNRKETDCFAHIGFTIEDGRGIVEAQTTNNYGMIGDYRQGDEVLNINKVLTNFGIKMSTFLKLSSKLKWDIKDIVEMVKKNSNQYAIAYNKDGRIIINVLTSKGFNELVSGTFIRTDNFIVDKNYKVYVLLDLNLPFNDDMSMIAIQYNRDSYGTMSLARMQNIFGSDITKQGYLSKLGISSEDYVSREAIDPAILLHKLIDEHDEAGAIKLIEKEGGNIDVNFEFTQRTPIFSAINNKMFKLFDVLVKHPKFDTTIEDGFGETLLQSLLFLHGSEDIISTDNDTKMLTTMINSILDNELFDFNAIDLNNDTAINTACEYPSQVFVVDKLARMKNVNVNVVNDFNCTALGNCIRNNNLEALAILGQRPDLVVREEDKKYAKMFNVDLDKYIKPNEKMFNEKAAAHSLEEEFAEAMA